MSPAPALGPMYTQCPECLTIYRIDEDALQTSLGIVLCGRCSARFDALRTLSDTLPATPDIPMPEQTPEEHLSTLTEEVPAAAFDAIANAHHASKDAAETFPDSDTDEDAGTSSPDAVPDDWFSEFEQQLSPVAASAEADTTTTTPRDAAEPGVDSETAPVEPADEATDASDEDPASEPDNEDPATEATPAPVYVRPRQRFSGSLGWTLGCLALALLLAVQLAWANRVALYRNPATHPWVAQLCGSVPCRLPLIKDIAQLQLLSRDVRPDPNAAGALTITAGIRNNASFRQPWPVVVVELNDLENNPVAMRRFRPADYMPDPQRRAAGLAPGATAAVAFEVVDPGKRAVAFQFHFQ